MKLDWWNSAYNSTDAGKALRISALFLFFYLFTLSDFRTRIFIEKISNKKKDLLRNVSNPLQCSRCSADNSSKFHLLITVHFQTAI